MCLQVLTIAHLGKILNFGRKPSSQSYLLPTAPPTHSILHTGSLILHFLRRSQSICKWCWRIIDFVYLGWHIQDWSGVTWAYRYCCRWDVDSLDSRCTCWWSPCIRKRCHEECRQNEGTPWWLLLGFLARHCGISKECRPCAVIYPYLSLFSLWLSTS